MNIIIENRKNRIGFKSLTILLTLAFSLLFISACSDAATERVEEVGGVTARQIIENPNDYLGKTITVSGNVEDIYDPRAFDMDSTTSVGNLLVLGAKPFPKVPNDTGRIATKGDIATVTGVVRMMTTKEEVEKELGWDLTPQIVTTYNMKPVLIATTSSFRAGTIPADKPEAKDMAENETTGKKDVTDSEPSGEIVNFADFETAVDRKSFVGKRVNLKAINVESVVGDRAFYVGNSRDKRILIIFQEEEPGPKPQKFDGKIDVDKGQKISLEGIVRTMPSVEEAKRQFGNLMSAETLNGLKDEETYIYTDDPRIVQVK